MKRLIILSLFSLSITMSAQTVVITGQVEDANGSIYVNGSGVVNLVPQNQTWLINTTNPVPSPIPIAGLDSSGKFSVSLTNTSLIQPSSANPQWQFSFCSNAALTKVPICFTMSPMSLTSSQDISASIKSQAALIPITGLGNLIAINGTSLTSGDTVNFNATTPAAPTNGINIQFQTSNSGLTDSVSGYLLGDGNAAHCLVGTGSFVACPGGSSGVTGSGTQNKLAVWTSSSAIGDSVISATVSNVTIGNGIHGITGYQGALLLNQYTGAGSFCPDNSNTPLGQPSCYGLGLLVQNESTTSVGAMTGLAIQSQNSFVTASKLFGIFSRTLASNAVTDEYGAYILAEEGINTTVTNRHGLFALAYNDTGNTTTLNEAIVAQTHEDSSTNTSDWTIHILAPANVGGAMTTHAGLKIDAQGTGVPALISPQTFSALPSCSATYEGSIASVTDSTTATWGATIAGSSTNHVLAYCDGTNWTVMGK